MRILKGRFALFVISILLAAAIFSLFIDRIAIYLIERSYNLNVSYLTYRNKFFREFSFTGLGVTRKDTGIGFVSGAARIRPSWRFIFKGVTADFDLRDVYLRKGKDGGIEAYDNLAGLVAVPFESRWRYRKISGAASITKDGIRIKDLDAISDEIKVKLNGTIYTNNEVSSAITIYFSDTLASRIPEELASVVLNREEGGWKSLSVSLNGDLKSPSIQVSSELFRLNIRQASPSVL